MEIRPSKRLSQRSPRLVGFSLRSIRAAAAPVLYLGLLGISSWGVFSAYSWLTAIPPVPNCQQLPSLSSDASRLYCAERAVARSGKADDILAGFALVKPWTANHPLRNQINRAMKDWSRALLAIAQQKAEKGDLDGAIKLARQIPTSSPVQKEVKTAIADWTANQNRGQTLTNDFETALQQQDWQTAQDKLRQFSRLNLEAKWQAEVSRLRQKLTHERSARSLLEKLRSQVGDNPGNTTILIEAITQADQIDANYARQDVEQAITVWSQALLEPIATRIRQADSAGAIAVAQSLPFWLSVPPELHDVVWFSRAQRLSSRLPQKSLLEEIAQVCLTLLHLGQIGVNSPFHPQAQSLMPSLERQLQDLNQLQFATQAAAAGQVPALEVAIQTAQAIAPERPQRLYAQTLIAQWQKDIQRVVDRPNLVQAQQLAATATIPKLHAAIVQAQQIAPGRALQPEAKAAIARWQQQIQTIQDQPLLDQAQTLAQQKKYKDAIATASQIKSNRALFKKAQASIKVWADQIQIAEDQPILNQAKALADAGDVPAAIATASKIADGRALSGEAQTAIARWIDQMQVPRRRFRRYNPRYDGYDSGAVLPPPSYPPRTYRRAPSFQPPELPPP